MSFGASSSGDSSGDCAEGLSSEGSSSVGSTLCGVLMSESFNLFGASSPGLVLKFGRLILGSLKFGNLTLGRSNFGTLVLHLSIIFFKAYGIPATSGTPSNPRYARSLDDVGLALETIVEGNIC